MGWATRFIVLAFAGLLLTSANSAEPKNDAKQLQGKWTLISAVRGGQEYPKEKLKGEVHFEITGDKIKTLNTQRGVDSTFKLDPSKTPKTIDIAGKEEDFPILGIYEVKGDNLKICISGAGEKRPTEFKSEKSSPHFLYVLKRVK
jgi:uncharacterized protein (TIGR03067 family)